MKKLLLFFVPLLGVHAIAQTTTFKISDLAVPGSPAFIITDVSPTLSQTPATPKAFALGVAQSFQSGDGFPTNYSAEFSPYWWLKPAGRSAYSLVGLDKTRTKEDPFSGLKFVSASVAFVKKDLIPDVVTLDQKAIAFGVRATIIKVHAKGYATAIAGKIQEWHDAAQKELDSNAALVAIIARFPDPAVQDSVLRRFRTLPLTNSITKDINDLFTKKPLFAWDVAIAASQYGIDDSVWQSGRFGAWTNVSTYLPIVINPGSNSKNYLNLTASARYLTDQYQKLETGGIGFQSNFDIGGKVALEFDHLSCGVESLYRYSDGKANSQNRTIGFVSVKVANNLFVNGMFGENFDHPNKLVTVFGINWGFGQEQAALPEN